MDELGPPQPRAPMDELGPPQQAAFSASRGSTPRSHHSGALGRACAEAAAFSASRGSTPPSHHSGQRGASATKLADLGHRKKQVKENLDRLRYTLSDSVLQEQKCQQRVEKQTMMVGYHHGRAQAVNTQIRKLNTELKQQERQGWDSFLQRDQRLVDNSRFRNMTRSESAFSSPSLSRGSVGEVSPLVTGKNVLRGSGPAARGTAAQMSKAASALALPRTPGGTDGCMAVVADVVKSRIVPSGPQLESTAGSPVYSVASSSMKLTSSFAPHKPSKRNSSEGPGGAPGDSHSAAGGGTLLDWFEEQDRAKVSQQIDRPGTFGSDDIRKAEDSFDDEVEAMTAPENSKDMAAECAEVQMQKQEKMVKAQLDHEHRMVVATEREYQMDQRAEQRRQAEERRIQCQDREEIRETLLMKAGGAREAFDACDVSRSGKISLNELDGALRGLDVKYKDFTKLTKILDVFKLFDPAKKGYITFADLFPLDARTGTDTERMSTPEFWKYWCSQNKDLAKSSLGSTARSSKWEPSSCEESLELLSKSRSKREEVIEKKKWMRGMIQRLKHKGKSDARCREICALHLPKGTGPRDLEDVNTFSQAEVQACRKKYTDKVQESVRNIEKTVFDMHDLKKKLHTSKQQLYACTEEPHVRQKAMEDARISVAALGGLGAGLFNKGHAVDEDE